MAPGILLSPGAVNRVRPDAAAISRGRVEIRSHEVTSFQKYMNY